MKHYLLFYEFVEDYAEMRATFRKSHLEKAWAASGRGELVLAGALADPMDTGVLLFKSETPEVVQAFAKADPYVVNGLVRSWKVREWTTVDGADAAVAVRL